MRVYQTYMAHVPWGCYLNPLEGSRQGPEGDESSRGSSSCCGGKLGADLSVLGASVAELRCRGARPKKWPKFRVVGIDVLNFNVLEMLEDLSEEFDETYWPIRTWFDSLFSIWGSWVMMSHRSVIHSRVSFRSGWFTRNQLRICCDRVAKSRAVATNVPSMGRREERPLFGSDSTFSIFLGVVLLLFVLNFLE